MSAELSPRARLFYAGLAGAATALAQPPLGLWPALFIAGPALFRLWLAAHEAERAGRAVFLVGWVAGAVCFAFSLHWIIEPFLVDIARHGWMAPFALALMSFGLALFQGAGFWLAWRLRRVIAGPFALALGWSVGVFAQSYVLTGFPWPLPSYAWADTPVAQAGALIGPYGLSLLTLAAMLAPGALTERRWRIAPPLISVAALAGLWLWGAARIPAEGAEGAADRPVIRILQTNIDQRLKWREDRARFYFHRMLIHSSRPGAPAPAMVLWPESAVTFPIDMAPIARDAIRDALGPIPLGLGSLRLDAGPDGVIGPGALWRNSFFLLEDGALSAPYDKIHLVPFGEYLPLAGLASRLGLAGLADTGGGIVPGAAPALMRTPGTPPFAPLICYEIIFPRETARAADGAEWLAVVTNDAWFGGWAGPAQHLSIARMRAIETGLPIARSANRGHSAMIDPYGRAIRLPEGVREGAIDAILPVSPGSTYYRRNGERLSSVLFCVALLFSIASRRASA